MSSRVGTPLVYVECDVPEGVTLREWRREQADRSAGAAPVGPVLGRVRRARRRPAAGAGPARAR